MDTYLDFDPTGVLAMQDQESDERATHPERYGEDEPNSEYCAIDGAGVRLMVAPERECMRYARQNAHVLYVSEYTDQDSAPVFERESARGRYEQGN